MPKVKTTIVALILVLFSGALAQEVRAQTPQLYPGDLNDDGCVNTIDSRGVLNAYSKNATGDANGDGTTNQFDVALVMRRLDATCRITDLPSNPKGPYYMKMAFGGVERTYQVYVPSFAFQPPSTLPMVIAYHGGGYNSDSQVSVSGMNLYTEIPKYKYVMVYPDGVNGQWNDGRASTAAVTNNADDVGFTQAIRTKIQEKVTIDPLRIFATGISNGGMMIMRIACEQPTLFAALAPVATSMPQEEYPNCNPDRPVATIYFQGTDDPLVPWAGGGIRGNNDQVLPIRTITTPTTKIGTFDFWIAEASCTGTPIHTNLADNKNDGTTVATDSYGTCTEGRDQILYTITGGGHTWPGGVQYLPESNIGKTSQEITASTLMLDFFSSHARPSL